MLISIPFKSHDIHVFYVSMHGKAREYKEDVKNYNDSRKQKGKEVIRKPISVEMNNFQDPQVRKKTAGAFFFFANMHGFSFFIYSDVQSATFGTYNYPVVCSFFVLTFSLSF